MQVDFKSILYISKNKTIIYLIKGEIKVQSHYVEAIADSNFDFEDEEEEYRQKINEMMADKYKDDWLNLATKWMGESKSRLNSGVPDIQDMCVHLQNKYRTVILKILY